MDTIAAETPPPAGRAVFAAALLAALALGVWEARGLWLFYTAQPRLPLWDMARHGWAGVELLRPLGRGDLLTFLDRLNRQDSWPFGFSLLLLPFLAAGGAGFASATLASVVLFAVVPLLLVWVGREVEPGPGGPVAGLLAGACWAASPLPRVYGILVMRETAGVALALLAFALYARALRRETRGAYRAAGFALLALLLVKYNYGLLWLLAAGLHQVVRLPARERRALGRGAAAWLWPWRANPSKRPGRIAFAVVLYLLAACVVAGVNIGYGVYLLLLGGAVALALAWRRDQAGLAARWQALPSPVAALLAAVVLPLWVWFLSPAPIHPKAVFAFLHNRPGEEPLLSAAALLLYPRAFFRDFAPAPWLAALVLAGVVLALFAWRRAADGSRALALFALVGCGLTVLHPFKEPRFLATAAPFVILLGSVGLVRTAAAPFARRPAWQTAAALLAAAVGLAAVALAAPSGPRATRLAADYQAASAPPAYGAVLQELNRQARPGQRTAYLGGANELSEALVRWWLAQRGNDAGEQLVEPPRRFASGLPPAEVQRHLARWLARERPERVLVLRPLPGSPLLASADYRAYNAWQLDADAALRAAPDWEVVRRRRLRGQRLEVLVLELDRAGRQTGRSGTIPPP